MYEKYKRTRNGWFYINKTKTIFLSWVWGSIHFLELEISFSLCPQNELISLPKLLLVFFSYNNRCGLDPGRKVDGVVQLWLHRRCNIYFMHRASTCRNHTHFINFRFLFPVFNSYRSGYVKFIASSVAMIFNSFEYVFFWDVFCDLLSAVFYRISLYATEIVWKGSPAMFRMFLLCTALFHWYVIPFCISK